MSHLCGVRRISFTALERSSRRKLCSLDARPKARVRLFRVQFEVFVQDIARVRVWRRECSVAVDEIHAPPSLVWIIRFLLEALPRSLHPFTSPQSMSSSE